MPIIRNMIRKIVTPSNYKTSQTAIKKRSVKSRIMDFINRFKNKIFPKKLLERKVKINSKDVKRENVNMQIADKQRIVTEILAQLSHYALSNSNNKLTSLTLNLRGAGEQELMAVYKYLSSTNDNLKNAVQKVDSIQFDQSNKLTKLPYEFLKQFPNLQHIHLYNTEISNLEAIGQLRNLSKIFLKGNDQLKNLEPLKKTGYEVRKFDDEYIMAVRKKKDPNAIYADEDVEIF